jgi:hypothetical protein
MTLRRRSNGFTKYSVSVIALTVKTKGLALFLKVLKPPPAICFGTFSVEVVNP